MPDLHKKSWIASILNVGNVMQQCTKNNVQNLMQKIGHHTKKCTWIKTLSLWMYDMGGQGGQLPTQVSADQLSL